jgi:hypothetical protein
MMTFEHWLQIGELAKWPLAVIIVVLILKGSVQSLIARVRRAAVGNKAFEFSENAAIVGEQQQIAKPPETAPVVSSNELPPPAPSPAVARVEAPIAAAINSSQASEEIKRSWLIRIAAIARLERAHEATYRVIMGSQLSLLLQANAVPHVDFDGARSIYNEAKARYPDLYKTFEFETWVGWLSHSGLTETKGPLNSPQITITDIGKEFLHYLVHAGLTTPKYG